MIKIESIEDARRELAEVIFLRDAYAMMVDLLEKAVAVHEALEALEADDG